MKRSTDRIRTTHTGSLPRPAEMLTALRERFQGSSLDEASYEVALKKNVAEIVKRQIEAGIDVVSDGECSKPSFRTYLAERIAGFESRVPKSGAPVQSPVNWNGRDVALFPDYYNTLKDHDPFINAIRMPRRACVAPIKYVGQKFVHRDIANLKAAMAATGAEEAFMPSSGPVPTEPNEHYTGEEEYFEAYGEAMREEYRAILDAGLLLQVDDPHLVCSWDGRRDMDVPQYRKWMQKRIEHINHALRDLPQDRIRFHTCYGVNFGPRLSDLQLDQVLDLMLTVRAGAVSFEAANPRHDHEFRFVQSAKLDGKVLIPGAVTHSNVTIEHAEVVADRIERWAKAAGRENVLFGNDCGFQSTAGNTEIPESVAWAKLRALGDGAKLATKRLWT